MLVHPWVYHTGCLETWFWESTICLTRATAGPCSHCKSWSSIGSFTAYPSPPTSKLFSTSWWGSTFAWPDDGRKAWLKTTWNITSCDQASERRCPYFVIKMNFLYNLFSIQANLQYYSYGSCSIWNRKTTDWFLYCCKITKLPVIYTNIIFLYSFTVNLLHSRMELKFVESRALNI